MYAAFNTLQLELERLILLRESISTSGQADKELTKLDELDRKIYSHEKAIKVIVRINQSERRRISRTAEEGAALH